MIRVNPVLEFLHDGVFYISFMIRVFWQNGLLHVAICAENMNRMVESRIMHHQIQDSNVRFEHPGRFSQ